MNTSIILSERTIEHLNSLSPVESDADSKVRALLEAEYRRRLSRYHLTDRALREKYGMSFAEFEYAEVAKQRGYTWDVESDASDWELAVSGIETMRRKLAELLSGSINDDQRVIDGIARG